MQPQPQSAAVSDTEVEAKRIELESIVAHLKSNINTGVLQNLKKCNFSV